MTQIEQLQQQIEKLSDAEFLQLRRWFAERDWERWDQQIEADASAEKLNFLVEEAMVAKKKETLQEL